MYAVIKTGGKQYRVAAGQTVDVEKLAVEAGSQITLDSVLLVAGDGLFQVGKPTVAGAAVTATVVDFVKGPKVFAFKYTHKKRIRRKRGHRQPLTRLKIDGIQAGA